MNNMKYSLSRIVVIIAVYFTLSYQVFTYEVGDLNPVVGIPQSIIDKGDAAELKSTAIMSVYEREDGR